MLTKNYKNIFNGRTESTYSISGSTYYYVPKITPRDTVTDTAGDTYSSYLFGYSETTSSTGSTSTSYLTQLYASQYKAWNINAHNWYRFTSSPSQSRAVYVSCGYTNSALSENDYVLDNSFSGIMTYSYNSSNTIAYLTFTNNTANSQTINCIGLYRVLYTSWAGTTPSNVKNFLYAGYKFDDITIEAGGSATIVITWDMT